MVTVDRVIGDDSDHDDSMLVTLTPGYLVRILIPVTMIIDGDSGYGYDSDHVPVIMIITCW